MAKSPLTLTVRCDSEQAEAALLRIREQMQAVADTWATLPPRVQALLGGALARRVEVREGS
jgi:hypothetical protein